MKHIEELVTRGSGLLPNEAKQMLESHENMRQLLLTVLIRLEMEPEYSVFPCSAMRKDIREALDECEKIATN